MNGVAMKDYKRVPSEAFMRARSGARRIAPRTASTILKTLFTEMSKRDITNLELAEKLNTHSNNVSGWRAGRATPTVMIAEEIAAHLGAKIQIVFDAEPEPPYKGLLTDFERRVLAATVETWNLATMLPKEHDDDINEFRHLIHQLQEKILARPARRAENGE